MNEIKKEEKVFSVILRLIVICLLALGSVFITSCSTEDVCGTITGFGIDSGGRYMYVDGSKEYVTISTWEQSYAGDYICLESNW